MNNLTKKLLIQSGLDCDCSDKSIHTLIQLIVKECSHHVFIGEPSDGDRLKIGREIRDHFGFSDA